MTFLFSEFLFLVFFSVVAILMAIVIFIFSIVFATRNNIPEKLSPYECGFDPFEDARNEFDIRFYLVALLFLVFDIEASFLFPWAFSLSNLSAIGFWVMIDFFFELVIGFFYVWKIGALEWELFFGWKSIMVYAEDCKSFFLGSIPISAYRSGVEKWYLIRLMI